jgi:beta-lactamase regulating signal transducer with metallopeptidase domain
METAASILAVVGRASLQGALLIAAVWLVCRLFPRLPAGLRCGLWWLACAKLVLGLVWVTPVRLAVLPAVAEPVSVHSAPRSSVPDRHPEGEFRARRIWAGGSFPPPDPSARPSRQDDLKGTWQAAVLALWAAGVLALLGLTVWQHRRARQIVRRSMPVAEPWLAALFAGLRGQLGVSSAADLRLSAEVETPQVMGLARPVVLLPAAAPARLSRSETAMTLCHELLHVRRGDLWLGWLPALAQRLFFFHPLVHLAVREYVLAREAACDAEVLRVLDPAPETYGRLLLRLGVTPQLPKLAAAGAAPSFQILKRRLQMLQNAANKKRLHPAWWALVALVASLTLVPFTMTAQEAPPAPGTPVPEGTAQEASPAPGTPVAAPEAPEPAELPAPAKAPTPPPHLPAPRPGQAALPIAAAHMAQHRTPPVPPVPPTPPVPPVPPTPPRHHGHHGDGDSYILLSGKSTIMNGSTDDIAKVRKLRKSDNEELFWFERGGKEYVVRDAATVKQVKALFEPQQKLGEKQGELGAQQGELGARQGALGAQQGQYGAKQAELGAKMAKLGAEQARLDREGKSTDALEEQMEQLSREQEKLSEPQEALGRQQEELGRQQEALGRQQEELGRQQEELARKAEEQLKTLTDKAIANGTAQAVK